MRMVLAVMIVICVRTLTRSQLRRLWPELVSFETGQVTHTKDTAQLAEDQARGDEADERDSGVDG